MPQKSCRSVTGHKAKAIILFNDHAPDPGLHGRAAWRPSRSMPERRPEPRRVAPLHV